MSEKEISNNEDKNTENIGVQINGISITEDEFYEQLTMSSSVFTSKESQERFRKANILIVGAGSIGNPVAVESVRAGAMNLTVMDPDTVEISNLSRQRYTTNQVGKNKAEMTKENLRKINPFVRILSEPLGMTVENAKEYVESSDIVIDAVDIRALDVIYELHRQASLLKKPVVVGYDLAGTAMVVVYRYDKGNIQPLNGELNEEKIKEFNKVKKALDSGLISDAEFLNYTYEAFTGPINPLKVPVEQLEELINREPSDNKTYQLGATATVLSALIVESSKRILNDEDVKDIVSVDIFSEIRRSNPNVLKKMSLLLRVLPTLKQRKNRVQESLNKII
jgi:molybdopterin/thiamine biosynthesis adenylyltransferase